MNADGTYSDYYWVSSTLLAEVQYQKNGAFTRTLMFLHDEKGAIVGVGVKNAGDARFTHYYYAKNLQGDVVAIYRSDYNSTSQTYYPTLVASYEYDVWGKVTSVKGSSGAILSLEAYPNHIAHVNPIRYRGYYYDTETGFYYLQSRYYDPAISRFINADSYGSTGQGLLGTNMFAYCNNNPVNHIDPSGCISITVPASAPGWSAILEALAGAGVYINPVAGILVLGLLTVKSGDKSPIKTASASVSSSSAVSEKIDWNIQNNRINHILNGTDGGHIDGWNKMGIDPSNKNAWGLVYPVLRYVVDNYDTISQFAVDKGAHIVKYTKEFAQLEVTVVVQIWVSADGLIQRLSNAWAAIH